jgi:hypothetical protein
VFAVQAPKERRNIALCDGDEAWAGATRVQDGPTDAANAAFIAAARTALPAALDALTQAVEMLRALIDHDRSDRRCTVADVAERFCDVYEGIPERER